MNPITISVLIPAFNEEDYIAACLAPLVDMQKKYRDQDVIIEIIVCDNNSTDKTAQIVSSFSPYVILIHETKKGPAAARQAAFLKSTGDIIATMDADCVPNPDWIERALNDFENPNVVSVAGLCEFSNDYSSAWAVTGAQKYLFPTLHYLTTKFLNKGGMMLAGNAWFMRGILEKIGGFDTSYEFHGDDASTTIAISKAKDKNDVMLYDPKLIVQTSSRRYKTTGYWKTMFDYIMNHIWVKLFKKNYN